MTDPRCPFTPGRPRIYRRRPGAWAYECHCAPVGRNQCISVNEPNHDSHADALLAALNHIRYGHLDLLERMFQVPAYQRAGEQP